MRNERLKNYFTTKNIRQKKKGEGQHYLKNKKYEYGHSTGYEALVWTYTLYCPQTDVLGHRSN